MISTALAFHEGNAKVNDSRKLSMCFQCVTSSVRPERVIHNLRNLRIGDLVEEGIQEVDAERQGGEDEKIGQHSISAGFLEIVTRLCKIGLNCERQSTPKYCPNAGHGAQSRESPAKRHQTFPQLCS